MRSALRNTRLTMRWAFWNTIVAVPLMYWFIDSTVMTLGLQLSTLEAIAVTALVVTPFMYLINLGVGFAGQCIGAFAARHTTDAAGISRVGTQTWWVLYTSTYVVQTAATLLSARYAAMVMMVALFTGLPILTLLSCRMAQNPRTNPEAFVRDRFAVLARRLVIYRIRNGRRTIIDLRGATIGLIAGAVVLSLSFSQFLWLLQGAGLVSLTRLYNSEPQITARISQQSGELTAQRERMVIVDFDPTSRRLALSTRSEAALQADAIRKLKGWGARAMVLLTPWEHSGEAAQPPGTPLPTRHDRDRSRRDIPALAKVVKGAGNVILALPAMQIRVMQITGSPEVESLMHSAVMTGLEDISSFGTPQLPALLFTSGQTLGLSIPNLPYQPVPVALAALDRAIAPNVKFDFYQPDHALFGTQQIPLIPPGVMAVDFHGDRQGHDFRHVSYRDILNGEPLYAPKAAAGTNHAQDDADAGGQTAWITPKQFYAGKLVFLNSLGSPVRDTPIGTLSECEVLAYATATLLAGSSPQAFHPVLAALIVLALGAIIGHLSGRRTPISAGFQVAVICAVIGVLSVAVFLLSGAHWWLDPVVPILATLSSYVAVTQFAFGRERHERERNRDLLRRFVAPQVVEELLDAPEEHLGLGGSRRLVCVLFADVRDFTPFSEQHSPEQVIEVVNDYMTALTDVLYAYEGILDKYTGDGLMATFRVGEVPRADVCRAIQAAAAMRDRAAEVSRLRKDRGLPALSLGFGLHFGEAIVGLVGNPNRFEYTALGHTVVVAARLQTLAAGGEVVVSDAVYTAADGAFEMMPGEPVTVKGMAHPVHPYRITPTLPAVPPPTPELMPHTT